ncbi:MAG: response regulator transcription factor [Anaerolinea sp.]|nr:response regulator transcription factor [Anaerolinea sp.]
MAKILIIEDEPELVRVLRSYLERAGYAVISSGRGDDGLQLWEREKPDLVLLDLNLPGADGLDVARAIRKRADTPLIMVTARVEEADRLVGLELGADDYIPKPFSPREVVARVRAVLRRATKNGSASTGMVLKISDLEIDLDAHAVICRGQKVDLTPTEFDLLATMARHPGRVFSRLQLLEAVQGVAYEGYERTVDAHIKNLRSKIEADARHPRYIQTVFGVGYRMSKE